jgi:hypothetical protein
LQRQDRMLLRVVSFTPPIIPWTIRFILRIRPLGAIHYVVSGPFEVLLLALLLNRGVRYLGITQDND